MKILFLTPSVRLLGARQSLLALVQRLPNDVEPLVICPGEGGLTEELRQFNVSCEVVPHGAWRKLGGWLTANLRQMPQLRRIAQEFAPNIIHCNEFHSTPQGVMVARAWGNSGGKVGVTSHIRLGITPRQIKNYHLAGCQRIVAVSDACRSLFEGSGLIDRVRVVYNGVDVSRFSGATRDRSLRESFGWGDETLVFGLLGLVSPRKNQMIAAEAIAQANAAGVPARLLLAGDAFKSTLEYGDRLRERLKADDLRDKVQWLPFQQDVASLYGAMDVNMLISGEEGFGRTIIEAGAMGIPSIGARTGGIPELIRESESGWLVPEGDASALATAMGEIWGMREKLAKVGESAQKHVTANFTIEAHVEAMMHVWNEVLE